MLGRHLSRQQRWNARRRRAETFAVIVLALGGVGLLVFGVTQLVAEDSDKGAEDEAGIESDLPQSTDSTGRSSVPERLDQTILVADFTSDPSDGLPAVGGSEWNVVSGAWRTSTGGATTRTDGLEASLAIFDTGADAGVLTVAAEGPAHRAGVVFGRLGDANFWRLEPNVDLDVMLLIHFEGGVPTIAGATGPVGLDDGYVLTIDLTPDRLRVLVDGVLEIDEMGPDLVLGTEAGLYGAAVPFEAPDPVWSALAFTRRLADDATELPSEPG